MFNPGIDNTAVLGKFIFAKFAFYGIQPEIHGHCE